MEYSMAGDQIERPRYEDDLEYYELDWTVAARSVMDGEMMPDDTVSSDHAEAEDSQNRAADSAIDFCGDGGCGQGNHCRPCHHYALAQRRKSRARILILSFVLFIAGLGVLVLYTVWKHDLGTGTGLCALVWTVGGGAYSIHKRLKEKRADIEDMRREIDHRLATRNARNQAIGDADSMRVFPGTSLRLSQIEPPQMNARQI